MKWFISHNLVKGNFWFLSQFLGLELKKPKSYYYKYLDNDIYKDLKKDDIVLEIEAYANQANIAQTLNAFEYFCFKYN